MLIIIFLNLFSGIIKMGIVIGGILNYKIRKGRVKYILLFIILGGIFTNHIVYNLDYFEILTIVLILTMFSVVFLFREQIYKLFILFIGISLGITVWETLCMQIIRVFYSYDLGSLSERLRRQTICSVLTIIILLLIWYMMKKNKIILNLRHLVIHKTMYLLIFSGIFVITSIVVISGLILEDNNQKRMDFAYFFVILIAIIFELICISLVFLFNSREKYKMINKIIEENNYRQIEYYKMLLEQDEETRRFRHDIMNHMLCLKELLLAGKLEELEKYFNDINLGMEKIRKTYDLGNDIINAIINFYSNKGKENNIYFKIKGMVHIDLNVSMIDLCTIVSNVVSNAFEASTRTISEEDKTIYIQLKCGSKYLEFKVTNPSVKNSINDEMKTSKKDQKNHGFGIQNVKDILKKYDGTIEFKEEVDSVTTIVVLRIS